MSATSSPLVNAGFSAADLHLLQQGLQRLINETHLHTSALANTPTGCMDENTVTILDYYSRRLNSIAAIQKRLTALKLELGRKQNNSVAHNLSDQTSPC
jgi:hypothetical protein